MQAFYVVPGAGVEPTWPCGRGILSAVCKPFHHPGVKKRRTARLFLGKIARLPLDFNIFSLALVPERLARYGDNRSFGEGVSVVKKFFPRLLASAVVVVCCSVAPEIDAEPGRTRIDITRGGVQTDSLLLSRGAPTALAVSIDGRSGAAITEPVTWTAAPAGVVAVHDDGGGRATVTALQDRFDDPAGRDPVATLSVCVGQNCTSISAVGLLAIDGVWRVRIDVAHVPYNGERDLQLVQDGRKVTCRGISIRFDGAGIRMTSGGGLLTRLNGTIISRTEARGTWANPRGFSGTWVARRLP